jgi:hypothetical protein
VPRLRFASLTATLDSVLSIPQQILVPVPRDPSIPPSAVHPCLLHMHAWTQIPGTDSWAEEAQMRPRCLLVRLSTVSSKHQISISQRWYVNGYSTLWGQHVRSSISEMHSKMLGSSDTEAVVEGANVKTVSCTCKKEHKRKGMRYD